MNESISNQSLRKLSRLSNAINEGIMSPTLTRKYAVQTNSRLIYVFSHLVKAFLETENEIQKSLTKMGLASAEDLIPQNEDMLYSLEDAIEKFSISDINEEYFEDDANLVTFSNSNGANQSSVSNSFLELENLKDDVVLGFSQRLRSGVDKVLQVLNESLSQNSSDELKELLRRNIELSTEVKEEANRREMLTQKLLACENQMRQMQTEKVSMEQQLQNYDETKRLVNSLQTQLDDYKSELRTLNSEKDRLQKSKVTLSNSLPQLEQKNCEFDSSDVYSSNSSSTGTSYFSFDNGSKESLIKELMNDIDSSNKEIKKMELERRNYVQRIQDLEQSLERIQNEQDKLITDKRIQLEDFNSQIEALQKQVNQYKRFIEEQTQDREQEREEFAHEVKKLNEIYREKEKQESNLKEKIQLIEEQLNNQYQEKQAMQQKYDQTLQKLNEATRSVHELQQVLSELEVTNEKTIQTEKQLNEKINRLESALNNQRKANEEMKKDHTDQSLFIAHSFLDEMLEKTERIRCASFDQRLMGSPPMKTMSFVQSSMDSTQNVDSETSELSSLTMDCSFDDAKLLGSKIKAFYEIVDSLNHQNSKLKSELIEARNAKKEFENRFEELGCEKTRLEADLNEIRRTKQVLQDELNNKQLQLASLKQKLEENVNNENAQYKQAVENLRNQLKAEEDRCSALNQKLAFSIETLEDKDGQLQQVMMKLDSLQIEKARIDGERGALLKTNNELASQQEALKQELASLQEDLVKEKQEHIQTEQQDAVLPQLFEILLKDKEEEIQVLSKKLNQFQTRLRQLVPDSSTEDSLCLLNELQFRLRRYQDREQLANNQPIVETAKPVMVNKSTGTLSKHLHLIDKSVNTDPHPMNMAEEEDKMRKFVLAQLGDLIEKLEEQHVLLAAYEKDNIMLRKRLNLAAEKMSFYSKTSRNESLSPSDSDFEADEDEEEEEDTQDVEENKIDDTLCLTLADVHNQSMELCKLTKRHRAQSMETLRDLIAQLPDLLLTNDTSEEDENEWKLKFMNNFPDQEIGELLIDKLSQIRDIHYNALKRSRLGLRQLDFTKEKLAEAETLIDKYRQLLESKRNDLNQYENELKKLRKNRELLQNERSFFKAELTKNKEQINQLNRKLAEMSDNKTIAATSASDDKDVQTLYEQLRRIQAQKKALIFQKRYLMNVLSGLRQCAEPGDRTLNLLTRLSCLLQPNELSRKIAANCETLQVKRFKSCVYAVMATLRLRKLTAKKTINKSRSIESSVPQLRNHMEEPFSCMYTPMSSTHLSKSRSSHQLPTFTLPSNETYPLNKSNATSRLTFSTKSANPPSHQHTSHSKQLLTSKSTQRSASTLSNAPNKTHTVHTLSKSEVNSPRSQSPAACNSIQDVDSSLNQFYQNLKRLHGDIGFDLSATFNSN